MPQAEHDGNGGGRIARRCSMCGISWPPKYLRCYSCGEKMEDALIRDYPTVTSDEARSMMNQWLFEEYLRQTGRE